MCPLSVAGTFHSVGCQIVRRHVQQLGDTGREVFAIFDQDDTKNVMRIALKKHFKLEKTAAETEQAAEADELQDSQVPEWVRTQMCRSCVSACVSAQLQLCSDLRDGHVAKAPSSLPDQCAVANISLALAKALSALLYQCMLANGSCQSCLATCIHFLIGLIQ